MQLPRFLLITDRQRSVLPLPQAVASALELLPRGTAGILLREKDLLGRELQSLASELRAITSARGAPLIVSGRWDVAVASGADGVHLGREAPPFESVRSLVPASLAIGVSLHGAQQAPPSATYALISPIFPTASKPGALPIGIEGLRLARERNPEVPLFALGGISTAEAARACLSNGAHGIAMLGAVLAASDPAVQARRLYDSLSAAA